MNTTFVIIHDMVVEIEKESTNLIKLPVEVDIFSIIILATKCFSVSAPLDRYSRDIHRS